ncbi:putative tRNA pseudouridine(38-40) synthase [Helianthus anomalus]
MSVLLIYPLHGQDAGVHALSNVCHVDVERISKRKPREVCRTYVEHGSLPPHEPSVVKKAVNRFLQKNEGDIMITDVRCVAADFHARYKAQERTYFYRLLSGPEHPSTFEKDRAWHVPEELDLQAMQKACKVLVGLHDFTSFRASGCQLTSHLLHN